MNTIEGRVQVAEGALKTGIVLIGRAQQYRARKLLAGLRLHRQQALEAEHHVAVAELLAQGAVLDVRRAGALMNILSDKVIVKGSSGAALAAIAPQARQERGFCLVQGGDQLAVCQGQIVKRRLALLFNVRVKQA